MECHVVLHQPDFGPPGVAFDALRPRTNLDLRREHTAAEADVWRFVIDRSDHRCRWRTPIPELDLLRLLRGDPHAVAHHYQSARVSGHDHLGARSSSLRLIAPKPERSTRHECVESGHPD